MPGAGLARDLERGSHVALRADFEERRANGSVRECHGDLHLSNLVDLDGHVTAFDCIEFSASLRWIDVISDVAFLVMDLRVRERGDLAAAFLDGYLCGTGDYQGARLLRYYVVYRSLVRAKVAALQYEGRGGDPDALERRFNTHLAFAQLQTGTAQPRLYHTCGLSGSGKSWLSERLVVLLEAVRIRSDVERKRARPAAAIAYSKAAIDAVYEHMSGSAEAVLAGGTSVIVDATFIESAQRDRFAELARRSGAQLTIIYTRAPREVLETRIAARALQGGDPSDADVAVLAAQLQVFDEPSGNNVLEIDTTQDVDPQRIAKQLDAMAASR
ncbi:MAG: AAA family ATPase [Gammaproteobacteria bacterium]|nr:AAA family ATPase [Gammaproteobacteria bacterium]